MTVKTAKWGRLGSTILAAFVVATLLVFLCPLGEPAHAAGGMKQLIIGGYNDPLSKTATEYNTLGGGYFWTATANNAKQVVSTGGAFSNLAVELSVAPGGGGSYTITLLNVTQATSLAVTIADPATTSISAGSLSVNAGDVVQLQSTYVAPLNTPTARWSVVFEGNNANESLILGQSQCENSYITYPPIAHGADRRGSSVETYGYQIIPTSGKIKNLFVALSIDPGTSPDSYRFTLRVNGANSDDGGGNPLRVAIVADNKTGNDTTHEIPVLAGDYVDMMIEPLDTPSAEPGVWWGFTFVADTNGESLILGMSSDMPTVGSTEYIYLRTSRFYDSWFASEYYQGGQSGITLKKFYAMLDGASTQNYDLNVRASSAGGNTGIAITITAGNTTGNDTVNTYDIGDYDDLSISCLATAGGTARKVYWGLVCYIPVAVIIAPTVTNSTGASLITQTQARLNGDLTDDGGENCTVHIYWGDNDGGTTPANWDHDQNLGAMAAGTFLYDTMGLLPSTTYYYICYATNSAGSDWADSTASFTTQVFLLLYVVGFCFMAWLLFAVLSKKGGRE